MSTSTALTVGIDFGTTLSGWAWSSANDYRQVYHKVWSDGQVSTGKIPTCLLVTRDGETLYKFGYEAQDEYSRLMEDRKHHNYYYFENFKMLLYQTDKLSRGTTLSAVDGRRLPALSVFALSIKFLKEDAENEFNKKFGGFLRPSDISWVLTVPAIWQDAAKQFMKEAAIKAGIDKRRLTVALEPEAASVYCSHVPIIFSRRSKHFELLQPGQKYMIVDAGGGTVDVSVHEVLHDRNLRELHQASGGGWGGLQVQEAFRQFCIKLIGSDKVMEFKENHLDDYLALFRDFEVKKKRISPSSDNLVTFSLCYSLLQMLGGTDEAVNKALRSSPFADSVTCCHHKLRISPKIMQSFFKNAMSDIKSHIRQILQESEVGPILLVGGFSESDMLREAIVSEFPSHEVIVPQEAGLSVLKGAVLFGHSPSIVRERISRYTYGFDICKPFVQGQHREDYHKIDDNGEKLCRYIFQTLIHRGQAFELNKPVYEDTHYPSQTCPSSLWFKLYATESQESPGYITAPGCRKVGEVEVKVQDTSLPFSKQAFKITVYLGGTEIYVRYTEISTGKVTKASFEFLECL